MFVILLFDRYFHRWSRLFWEVSYFSSLHALHHRCLSLRNLSEVSKWNLPWQYRCYFSSTLWPPWWDRWVLKTKTSHYEMNQPIPPLIPPVQCSCPCPAEPEYGEMAEPRTGMRGLRNWPEGHTPQNCHWIGENCWPTDTNPHSELHFISNLRIKWSRYCSILFCWSLATVRATFAIS